MNTNEKVKASLIIEIVSKHFNMKEEELRFKKEREFNDARKIAILFIRQKTSLYLKDIGDLFQITHGAIVYAIKTLETLTNSSTDIQDHIKVIRSKIPFKSTKYELFEKVLKNSSFNELQRCSLRLEYESLKND